jgi:hypothetical protein
MQNSGFQGGGEVVKPNRETKIEKQPDKDKVGGKRTASGSSSWLCFCGKIFLFIFAHSLAEISMFGYGTMGEKRTVVCQVGNFPVRYKYHEGMIALFFT